MAAIPERSARCSFVFRTCQTSKGNGWLYATRRGNDPASTDPIENGERMGWPPTGGHPITKLVP